MAHFVFANRTREFPLGYRKYGASVEGCCALYCSVQEDPKSIVTESTCLPEVPGVILETVRIALGPCAKSAKSATLMQKRGLGGLESALSFLRKPLITKWSVLSIVYHTMPYGVFCSTASIFS